VLYGDSQGVATMGSTVHLYQNEHAETQMSLTLLLDTLKYAGGKMKLSFFTSSYDRPNHWQVIQ
jgi:hypothetical protein